MSFKEEICLKINNIDYNLNLKYINKGSFGIVYKSLYNEKKVAIKEIILGMYMYTNEIDVLSKLKHKNIVLYIDHCFQDRSVYLIMEYCKTTLKDQIGKEKIDIIKFGIDVLNGLYFLHKNNIIHRDIKSSNILFKDKNYKISDFGFSIEVDNSNESVSIKGTENYYPPEKNTGSLTKKSDIWSLGVVFLEIINSSLLKNPIDNNNLDFLKEIVEKCRYDWLKNNLYKIFNNDREQRPSSLCLLNSFYRYFLTFNAIYKFININLTHEKFDIYLNEDVKIILNTLNKNKNIYVISVIGAQSSGKSTILNAMFNIKLKTGIKKTTEGCDIVIYPDYNENCHLLLLDVEGYLSPNNELEIKKLKENFYSTQGIKLDSTINEKINKESNDTSNKLSLKLGNFIWSISDVVIFCIKDLVINENHVPTMLEAVQRQQGLINVNKPILHFVCRSNSKLVEQEDINESNDDISKKLDSYKIINNISQYFINVVPNFGGRKITDEYIKDTLFIKEKILNQCINHHDINKNLITSDLNIWISSLDDILNCINNDINLFSTEERMHMFCEEAAKKCIEKCNLLINEQIERNMYKILDKNYLISLLNIYYEENAFGIYKEKFRQHWFTIVESSYVEYHQNTLTNINNFVTQTTSDLVINYQRGLTRYTPINIKEHLQRKESCLLFFSNILNEKDISTNQFIEKMLNNNIENVYILYYKVCQVKCLRNYHECNIGGYHDSHNFQCGTVTIYCERKCGRYISVQCELSSYKFFCDYRENLPCIRGCGTNNEVQCDVKTFSCQNEKCNICSKNCSCTFININRCSLPRGHNGECWCGRFKWVGCSYSWFVPLFTQIRNYCSGKTQVKCTDSNDRINCGYNHSNINFTMSCKGNTNYYN